MKVIQSRLGHGSIRVTMDVYGHLVEGLDQDAATKIGNYVDGNEVTA